MKLKPSPIKLNGDADDSNPHRSQRLSVVVGDRRWSRRLSVVIGDRCRSRRLCVAIGDQRRSRRLSVVVGTDGDTSTHHWRQSQCLSIAVGDRHRLRHLSIAVGTDGDASAHRWRRSWRLSVAISVDSDASALFCCSVKVQFYFLDLSHLMMHRLPYLLKF